MVRIAKRQPLARVVRYRLRGYEGDMLCALSEYSALLFCGVLCCFFGEIIELLDWFSPKISNRGEFVRFPALQTLCYKRIKCIPGGAALTAPTVCYATADGILRI